jgi:hypothetical protein
MATRTVTIVECDLCTREIDDVKSLGTIKIKKPQARKEQEHEICRDCIERLMTQIASTNVLEDGIIFSIRTTQPYMYDENSKQPQESETFETAAERRRSFEEAEIDDDAAFINEKMAQREEYKRSRAAQTVGEEPVAAPPSNRPKPQTIKKKRSDCSHPNKTRPWTNDNGKTMYRTCRDCKASIKMMTPKERAAYSASRTGGHDLEIGNNPNINKTEE